MKLAKLNTARTFGIEIEFNNQSEMSQQQLATYINKKFRRLECIGESYNHTTQAHWKIVTDSTCGLELVSPILSGQKGMKDAQCIIDCLASIEGVEVNRSCGIHVHVGAQGITPQGMRNVILQYAKNEEIINSVLAPSRRDTRWARPLVGNGNNGRYQSMEELANQLYSCQTVGEIVSRMGGRYNTVNVQCWNRQRTVEFRQHGGSLDSEKILNWAHFLVNTVETCMTETRVNIKLRTNPKQAFKAVFGNSKIVCDFMLGRANHFGFTQFGQVKTVEVKRTWLHDNFKVVEMTDGSFNVKQRMELNTCDVWNNVTSSRKTLISLLGTIDRGQTTRQLGKSLFRVVASEDEANFTSMVTVA